MYFLFPRALHGIPNVAGPHSLAKMGSSSHELSLTFRVSTASDPLKYSNLSASPEVFVLNATSTRKIDLR
jgi:hypothetical protein